MERSEMVDKAMKNAAASYNCGSSDFTLANNRVLLAKPNDPFFRMISFGSNAVVSVNEKFYDWCRNWFGKTEGIFCFDAPKLVEIGLALDPFNYAVGEIFDCFLPLDTNRVEVANVAEVDFALLENEEVMDLYNHDAFENALTPERPSDTKCAFVATKNGELCGVAGASRSIDGHFYIGVDVLLHARNEGIASRLIHHLTLHLLEGGVTTVYPTWYSNIPSRRTALRCGYRPVWIEVASEKKKCNKSVDTTPASAPR